MDSKTSLTDARDFAPYDYRRWTIGGVSLAVVGYATIAVTELWRHGYSHALALPLILSTAVCAIALLFALRGCEQGAVYVVLSATWTEIQSGFLLKQELLGPGLLALPIVAIAFGLFRGQRAALAFTAVTVVASVVTHRLSPQFRESGFTPQATYWLVLHSIVMFSAWVLLALSMRGVARIFEELRARQQDLSDTIRFAPDGMLVVDETHAVILLNPAAEAILGMPASRVMGQDIAVVLAEAAGATDSDATAPSDTGETPVALHWIARNGAVMYVEATWRRMVGGRREVLLRNVSERHRVERERARVEAHVAQAQRLEAVGQLAGGLSHDFNNILTTIGGLSELMRDEADSVTRAELADELGAARERGAALTRTLLAFANRDIVQPRVLELGAFLRTLEPRLVEVLGGAHSLALTTVPGCWVRADDRQIAQAVESLVANARDAMPTGGRCVVSVELQTETVGVPQVRLRVADEGVGMSPLVAERAFEPFFTTKQRGQGTGLGLTIVHAMAMQSGGVARIQSGEASGTRVEIDLPMAAPPTHLSPPAGVPIVGATGRTILLAEDDHGTRSTVARLLRRAGYVVIEARDGTEGLHLAITTREPIHLLLTDVMMPGLTGPALAERVREVNEQIPVLFMTGYAEIDVAAHLGAVQTNRELISKPFPPRDLLARVERLLGAQSTAETF